MKAKTKDKKLNSKIINFNNFWDPLISLINHLIREEYMGSYNLNYFEELRNKNSLKFFLKNI